MILELGRYHMICIQRSASCQRLIFIKNIFLIKNSIIFSSHLTRCCPEPTTRVLFSRPSLRDLVCSTTGCCWLVQHCPQSTQRQLFLRRVLRGEAHRGTGGGLRGDGRGGGVEGDGARGADTRVHGVRLVGAAGLLPGQSPGPPGHDHVGVGAVGLRRLEVGVQAGHWRRGGVCHQVWQLRCVQMFLKYKNKIISSLSLF